MTKIAVCTSADRPNVEELLTRLSDKFSEKSIEYVRLPYNDASEFQVTSGQYDGLILCHSIKNRRFAITDVMDAHYNEFLPNHAKVLGNENVAVVAHDFDWQSGRDHKTEMEDRMLSFKTKQPTTFECSSTVMTCGKLDDAMEMDKSDWQRLKDFLNGIPFPIKEDEGSPPHETAITLTQIQMSPVTIAKIVVPPVVLIIVARFLGNMSMTLVSLVLFVLLVARWLLFNDVPSGASKSMGKIQSAKINHHHWPRPNFQQMPWQKIPSKIMAYYSRDNAPKTQVVFELVIRVVTILWFLVVVFGVTNYYPLIRLLLVLVVMEPFACWLWMTAGRVKNLKTDILSGTADVGSPRWFAVQWQKISYSFWLYHGQVLATNPKILEVLIVELNGFFCLYLLFFGRFNWGSLFVITMMTMGQPLGYWIFFNAGKDRSVFLMKAKEFKIDTPSWSRVECVEAPLSFWRNFAKMHLRSDQLRTTTFIVLNEIPWFFLVYYYDAGFETLFRFILVAALSPFACQLWLTKAGKKDKFSGFSGQLQGLEWTRVPVWRVPDAFWLHYGRELMTSAKLFHKIMFALNLLVFISLIFFGDVGKATLVRVLLTFLLEPMANIILLVE